MQFDIKTVLSSNHNWALIHLSFSKSYICSQISSVSAPQYFDSNHVGLIFLFAESLISFWHCELWEAKWNIAEVIAGSVPDGIPRVVYNPFCIWQEYWITIEHMQHFWKAIKNAVQLPHQKITPFIDNLLHAQADSIEFCALKVKRISLTWCNYTSKIQTKNTVSKPMMKRP